MKGNFVHAALLGGVLLACGTGGDECVVSRRLPVFGLRAERRSAGAAPSPPAPASREAGGACHMRRLARVGDALPDAADSAAHHSTQMCARNSSALTCAVLAQNGSDAGSSRQRLRVFPAETPADGAQQARAPHARARLCAACDRQDVDAVRTRLMGTKPVSGRRQLSVGVPQRLSAERLLAAQLHRLVCNASATCPALEDALAGACAGQDCMRRGAFAGALLNRSHFEAPARREQAASDALWQRSWVWCPHSRAPTGEFAQCSGSVSRTAWLNTSTRAQGCVASIPKTSSSSTRVNFCLLTAKTQQLCAKMVKWRRDAQGIVCRASGRCPSSDFFYSPTTFDLREQQFVYDSVLDFYRTDAQRACEAGAQASAQQQANYENMGQCASVSIQPLLEIVEQLREGKRMLVLVGYHYYRVQFYLVQLLVSALVDSAAAVASASTDTLGRVADSLLREIMALMQVIGGFVDQLRDAIMELAMSRGVGKTIKDLLVFICKTIELVHNTLWSYVLCPLLRIAMAIAEFMINVIDMLLDIVRAVLFGHGVDVLDGFIKVCRDVVSGISRALGTCETKSFNCVIEPAFGSEDSDFGALPMPTRCWASYLTFFGDNQQLSCTKADTCKLAPLASIAERRVCGACPAQSNPNVQDFACHALTGICTCGVPELRSSSCFNNEDCQTDPDASCRLINDDLELSKASVACEQCQHERVCYETGAGGVCACGARRVPFHQCSEQDYLQRNQLVLRLNNLCLYTPTDGVVEFALSSVIPCQELDASLSSCAFALDVGNHFARGFRRVRRRLLGEGGEDARVFTYSSVDSVCRDALASESLRFTRVRCQEAFDASNATLVLLGLERLLPPCAFCSFADAVEAARHNPLAVLRLANPRMLALVLQRHGLSGQIAQLGALVHGGIGELSALLASQRRAGNATRVVAIQRQGAATVVRVEDTVIPPHVARTLELLLESLLPALESVVPKNASAAGSNHSHHSNPSNASVAAAASGGPPARRLLLFRELVLAVEERVKDGWTDAGRLHEAFAQSIEQVLTYNYNRGAASAYGPPAAEHVWPPVATSDAQECNELHELLAICIETAQGVFDGWLTLTHRRDDLQARPADSLGDAWPALLRADAADDPPDEAFAVEAHGSDDFVTHACTAGTAAALQALNIQPRTVYDVLFSVASAVNASFTCPYHAVQTCSGWRRRIWHAAVISLLWFCAVVFVVNAVGLSFLGMLLVPLFSIVLFQLSYGYTWTCAPMVPVCAWQDFTESIGMLLPLSLEVPDDLKRLDRHCLDDSACSGGDESSCLALRRYPPPLCLKSCREAPFSYVGVLNVVAWYMAEAGAWATDFAQAHAHQVPLLDHDAFLKDLNTRIRTMRRSSADSVRAHRVCAVLGAYMLLPYVFILLLVLAFLASLAQALATQLLPLFLLLCALFNAVVASANTQDEERLQALEKAVMDMQEEPQAEDEAESRE